MTSIFETLNQILERNFFPRVIIVIAAQFLFGTRLAWSQSGDALLPILGSNREDDSMGLLFSYDWVVVCFFLLALSLILYISLQPLLKLKYAQANRYIDLWLPVSVRAGDQGQEEGYEGAVTASKLTPCAYIRDIYRNTLTLISDQPFMQNEQITLFKKHQCSRNGDKDRDSQKLNVNQERENQEGICGTVKKCRRSHRYPKCYQTTLILKDVDSFKSLVATQPA